MTEKKLSAKEKLAKKAAKEVAPPSSKKTREVIEIGRVPEEQDLATTIDRLCAALHAKKSIDGHAEAAKAVVLPDVRERILRMWVDNGAPTENPKITTPGGSSFNMQVKDSLTGARGFKLPKDKDGNPVPLRDYLRENGCSDELIAEIESEFVTEDVNQFADMAKLEKETPDLAERLMALVLAANEGGVTTVDGETIKLSDEELGKILRNVVNVKVQEGFLDRSVGHAKKVGGTDDEASVAHLSAILTAVPPQWAFGQALSSSPEKMITKLLHEEPPSPQPAGPPRDYETPKYLIRQEGFTLSILRRSDMKLLAKKVCKDAMHTKNTVAKWLREPDTLQAFIGEALASA